MIRADQHWDAIFTVRSDDELGWYECDASQTLKFLDLIPEDKALTTFVSGAGTSVLVDALVGRGHELVLNDISGEALRQLRERIGVDRGGLTWLQHDISKPLPDEVPPCDVWLDRAVLHFLLDEEEIRAYFANLHAVVRPGGHVLLAEFSITGAPMCAGLDLHRYSLEEMTDRMGGEFELVKGEDYIFINSFGVSLPYIYGLYRRSGRLH